MLNKKTSLEFLQNQLKLSEWLLLSILLIPFFKILVSILNISTPIYYGPTVLIATLLILRKDYLNIKLLGINALVLVYISLGIYNNKGISASSIKIDLAALVYVNLAYVIYITFNRAAPEALSNLIEKHYKTSLKLSIIFMGICIFAFVMNCYEFPFSVSLEHIKQYLTFDRVNVELRGNLLVRFNPVALIKKDITNIRYIGQQLLILPITAFVYALLHKQRTHTYILCLILLVISVFLTNSRAMFLTLVAMQAIAYIPKVPRALHISYCLICCIFPFSLSLLSADFTSNRLCQINFVRTHLTLFGNGIGAYIERLNEICGYVTQGSAYQNIVTTSYDNIHIELIHYVGITGYLFFLYLILSWAISRNNYICRLNIFFIYIFLSLNFNLFEVFFLPVLLVTYFLAKQIDLQANKYTCTGQN